MGKRPPLQMVYSPKRVPPRTVYPFYIQIHRVASHIPRASVVVSSGDGGWIPTHMFTGNKLEKNAALFPLFKFEWRQFVNVEIFQRSHFLTFVNVPLPVHCVDSHNAASLTHTPRSLCHLHYHMKPHRPVFGLTLSSVYEWTYRIV